jgi:predicted nucleic acid-binding Zn ribbon protein
MVRSVRSVGAALPKALKALGISRRTREAQALWLWPQVVGEHLAGETRALKLTGGTLLVTASSPALAHQLHLERGLLIDRLNEGIGAPVVREIRFRQAGAPTLPSPASGGGRKPWR